MRKVDWFLVAGVVALVLLSLTLASKPKSDQEMFAGADGQAANAIRDIAPGYVPWSSSIWEPPSREVEGLLFSLQAALGAGVIGYFLGKKVTQRRMESRK